MIGNIFSNSKGSGGMKLVVGIAFGGLLAAVVYGVLFHSSFFSVKDKAPAIEKAPQKIRYSIQTEPQVEPEPQPAQPSAAVATPPPSAKTVAVAEPARPDPVAEEAEPEEVWEENDEDNVEEEYDVEADARTREIQQLKEALPNNILVPFERTQEEAEELLAVGQELTLIRESIENNTATYEDRQRYLDIVSRQFDDEIELINYCSEVAADSNTGVPNGLCSSVSEHGDQRLEEIEKMREDLRKEIMGENE